MAKCTETEVGNVSKFISILNLSQTCELLYRCDGSDEEDSFMIPALITRLYELVDTERADNIMRLVLEMHARRATSA